MNANRAGKKEKTVVLINGAMYLPGEGGYKRTMYLFDMLREQGHRPILLTSDFNHYKKSVRDINKFRRKYPEYADIQFVHMRPYTKNQSITRILAERDWTNEVTKWVKANANHLDTIMISMPDINTINRISKTCRANGIELVLDVRDLRPEAFRVILKSELLYRLTTFKIKRDADRAYASADILFAVSEEYLKRGMVKGSRAGVKKVVYIGATMQKFDAGVKKYKDEVQKPLDELWLTYAGTLGASYDMITVIDAVAKLENRRFDGKKLRLLILGQGPDRETFENHMKEIGASNITFVGFVDYERMAAILSKSDMTVNAIKRRGSQSIINKVADYFAAGIPMLNGCVCKEQQDMVDNYHVGLNYEPEDVESLTDAIVKIASNPELRKTMGANARKLALEKFDRDKTYREIMDYLYR